MTASLRGPLVQQGALRRIIQLVDCFTNNPPDLDAQTRRTAIQTIARILVTINPNHFFVSPHTGTETAVRPLVELLKLDDTADTRDLLPTFEALLALTNLASMDDWTRCIIITAAWQDIEELLMSSNNRITRAAVELVCNLCPCDDAMELFSPETPQSLNRLNILVALADSEDEGVRCAAGGGLASLIRYDNIVRAIANRERGLEIVLNMCSDSNEDIRFRGTFTLERMLSAGSGAGKLALAKAKAAKGVAILTECARKTSKPEILELAVQSLQLLMMEEGQ